MTKKTKAKSPKQMMTDADVDVGETFSTGVRAKLSGHCGNQCGGFPNSSAIVGIYPMDPAFY